MAGQALWESLVHGDWNGVGKSWCGRPESREGTAGTKMRYSLHRLALRDLSLSGRPKCPTLPELPKIAPNLGTKPSKRGPVEDIVDSGSAHPPLPHLGLLPILLPGSQGYPVLSQTILRLV